MTADQHSIFGLLTVQACTAHVHIVGSNIHQVTKVLCSQQAQRWQQLLESTYIVIDGSIVTSLALAYVEQIVAFA